MQEIHQNKLPDLRKTVIFNAPIQKVWKAVSTSEGIASWFMPNDFQSVIGYEFSLNAGPFGIQRCKVTELDPPYRLSFTWGNEGWHITFELRELEGKTEFTLIHSGWKEAEYVAQTGMKQGVIRNRMDNGWTELINEKLRKVVEA